MDVSPCPACQWKMSRLSLRFRAGKKYVIVVVVSEIGGGHTQLQVPKMEVWKPIASWYGYGLCEGSLPPSKPARLSFSTSVLRYIFYTWFFLVKTYVWHIYLVVSSIHSPITSITSPAWLAARSGDLHGSSLNFSRESKPIFVGVNGRFTFLGTNISHSKGTFEDDFPFPQVGYVNSLEGNYFPPTSRFEV